ncbi:unnamed protein product [Protopolystoma xenopodis]|uniref:Uncharacterized protein n=1 Tax=Protopolystoma xenopodis TaxID=117903 RepID=A0A3S4ZRQ7_9PLAT|nr:unnamed protein product [Protopolystoma xenopodis]
MAYVGALVWASLLLFFRVILSSVAFAVIKTNNVYTKGVQLISRNPSHLHDGCRLLLRRPIFLLFCVWGLALAGLGLCIQSPDCPPCCPHSLTTSTLTTLHFHRVYTFSALAALACPFEEERRSLGLVSLAWSSALPTGRQSASITGWLGRDRSTAFAGTAGTALLMRLARRQVVPVEGVV